MSTPATDPNAVVQPAPLPGAPTAPPGFGVFTLTDADGGSHRYEVRKHPPTEGTEILFALIALGAEPFASVVQSAFAVEDLFANGGTLREALDTNLESMVGKIEWAKVAANVRASLLSMPSTLVRDVLRYTWRDGQLLSNDVFYNAAFEANYLELMQAVWEVANTNRFLPRFSTSKTGGKAPQTPA